MSPTAEHRSLISTLDLSQLGPKYKCIFCNKFLWEARVGACCPDQPICENCFQTIEGACPLCHKGFFMQGKNTVFVADQGTRLDVMDFLEAQEERERTLKAPIPFILPAFELNDARTTNARHVLMKIVDARHFSPRVLAYAMQNGISHSAIKSYLKAFNADQVKDLINKPIHSTALDLGVPVLFFAVESGSEDNIRLLHEFGANLQAQTTKWKMGVLAYTILHTREDLRDKTELFRLLIALGADPTQVQKSLWENYTKPVPDPVTQATTPREKGEACIQKAIASAINVTQRYLLHLAHANGSPNVPNRKLKEAAQPFDFDRVLEVSYAIVGQPIAKKFIIQKFTCYFVLKQYESKPMVMAFTGIKGHGKTELAKQLGILLGCEYHYVNCEEMTTEMELFGPKPAYLGTEKASPLNRFLYVNEGKRCIVFLDEFDKPSEAIQNALLPLLDRGKYTERVNGRELNPGLKTIWIMATNGSEETLSKFTHKHEKLGEDLVHRAPLDDLYSKLRKELNDQVGPHIAASTRAVIPFLPFSKNEAAVVAHSFLLKQIRECREPFSREYKRFIGDLHLDLADDGGVCKLLAESYVEEMGARSLENAVTDLLMEPVVGYALKGNKGLFRDPEATRSLKRCALSIGREEVSKMRKINVREDGRVELMSARPKPTEPLFTAEEWERIDELTAFY